ncbi:phage tail tape measure protein [Serratia symbiotica]|uniref:phage tail tape measure protein n=1 Tax=Serratia symbiotica TaxID=138074 RepID=UPI001CF0D4F0|nr:phage tail tape measure protein [Serratia symbiotica]
MARDFDTQIKFGVQDNATPKIRTLSEEFRRLQSARERIGVRSEHSIQREIDRTMAAYNRLSRSGTLSASELSRAWTQTQSSVSKLRRELGETERSYQRLARAGKVAATIGGGVVATAAILRKPIANQMEYDAELRKQANFAFSNTDKAGRESGMKTINTAIQRAVNESGGEISEAFHAFEVMQRSGSMGHGPEMSIRALPGVMRIATATESEPAAVASLQASAVNFGLNEKDAHAALSSATTLSQHGAVGMDLLAKEGPEALESAKSLGFYGRTGYSRTMALFEATARGADTRAPEVAATYATNLLKDLASPTLANNFKNIKIGGHGIDIRSLIRADTAKGLTPFDTVDRAIRSMDTRVPLFNQLEKQIAKTTDPQKKAELEARRDQIHGQNVGQIFTNEYSRLGFLNWERNKDYYHDQVKNSDAQFDKPMGQTSADLDFELVQDSTKFKEQKMKNASIFASNEAIEPVADLYGRIAEKAAELANEFPILTAAVTGASSAFQAINSFGGGLLAAWAGKKVLGKLGGAGTVAAAEGAGAAAKNGGLLTRAGQALRGCGTSLLRMGGGVIENGLIANPYALALTGMLIPNNTVSGSAEMSELERLKQENLQRNNAATYTPASLDSFQTMMNFFRESNTAKPTSPAATTPWAPQAPQQPVVANIYLDSREVTEAVLRRVDVDARRQ